MLTRLQNFRRFRNLSLRAKLTFVILSICALALMCASATDLALSWKLERHQIMGRMQANAMIISLQSRAALEFLDPVAARENLAALHPNSYIRKACLYNEQRQKFAAYERGKKEAAIECPPAASAAKIYHWDSMAIYQDIWSGERLLGTLYLQYDLTDMYKNLIQQTVYKWLVMLLILGLVWPLSMYLQRVISQPVVQLANITRHFAKDRSQAIYAQKVSNDELGELVEAFNGLMEEIRRNEGRMEEAIVELTRSNSELERFAYICSHDLQEPLRMILNYANLLERRYKGSIEGDGEKFLGFITDSAARMRELITDILTYSRIGNHVEPMQKIDVDSIIDYVLKNMEASITESGAQIQREQMPTIKGNKMLLQQVFQNLIGNAIKFCKGTPEIHINVRRLHDGWEFSVRDNGIGIDPHYHERIFEIFKRLNRREEYRGTGIGLAICKKAVEYHGGRIWLVSAEGSGTTFYFTIPDAK